VKKLVVLGQELLLKLSPSFLTNAACPKYLKLHYVDRVDDKYIRIAAERGSAAHAALAELIGICQAGGIQPSSLSIDQIAEAVRKHTPHIIMSEIADILAWCRLWAERYQISKHIYGVEEKVALDEAFDDTEWDNASYRGILDIIDLNKNHLTITDWKSQPHILNQSELDAHEQGTMYCWLASKLYPHIETFTFRIWYLRYGFYAETTRTPADLEAFEQTLMIKEQKILEIDNWDPIPGKHCQYCDVIQHCPLANDLSASNLQVISQPQAIEAAKRITVMDALSKELKGKLKDYVKSNDAVRLPGNWVWGFRSKESATWDVRDLAEILLEHGHEIAEVSNVDGRKIKKLLKIAGKEDPTLEADLLKAQKIKVKAEFRGYKQGDTEDEEADVE
jgi:hypothetical protein